MSSTVALLHLAGWGALILVVLPNQSHSGGDTALLLGLAVSAYALGVRHAFDADHIVAIDNATRRLIAAGRRPMSVGFWFALGHSTVVVVSVVLLVAGIDAFAGSISDDESELRIITGAWGALVSGVFLVFLGALNLSSLRGLRKVLKTVRSGQFVESDLEEHLNNRGFVNALLRPLSRIIDRPTRMYPIGLLFGLGLDTAASISVFVVAGVLTPNLPWYAVLILPILFTAGMTLFDSADGILMNRVYRWASIDPYRKVYYNLIVTGVSVCVAFLVGGIGLISVLTDLGIRGRVLEAISTIDLSLLGVALIVFFALVWIGASLFWKYRNQRLAPVSPGSYS
jgi:high-affinity nickel-transport protein